MSKLNNSKSRIPGPNRFSSGCNMNWFWGDFWAFRKSEIKYTIDSIGLRKKEVSVKLLIFEIRVTREKT